MAGAIQWTIEQFWGELQSLKNQIDQTATALNADKLRLQGMYAAARRNYDPARDLYLAPLIRRNTELRLNYLKPVRDKFNEAVNAAAGALRGAGYTVPTLGEVGILPAVPVVAVTAVVVALSAVAVVWRLTQAQITRTNAMAAIFQDSRTTPEQKVTLSRQMQAQITEENKHTPPPLGFNLDMLVPLAGIVAAIVLVPPILKASTSKATA